MSLLDIIQKEVNRIAVANWDADEDSPKYTVSLLKQRDEADRIALTLTNNGSSHTAIIFPLHKASTFDYDISLGEVMEALYNRTI